MSQGEPLSAEARALLAAVEADLDARGWGRASLAPGRSWARGLAEVCAAALAPGDGPTFALALARGLATITTAQADSFPDNLFADVDYLAVNLARRARDTVDPPAYIAETSAQVVLLQHLFGLGTAINFRYTHDFAYGYDWAKWVAREPTTRARVLPFDREFLTHMERRAGEMLAQIHDEEGDVPTGEARNPFPFDREPAAEAALHRALADRGELPLAAWDPDARPVWDRPYAALRVAQAERMGLSLA